MASRNTTVSGCHAGLTASTVPASPTSRGNRIGKLKVGLSYCVRPHREIGTRWSAALMPSNVGIRVIVATTCL